MNRTAASVRAIGVVLGALLVVVLICWIVISLAAWRLAETWTPGD